MSVTHSVHIEAPVGEVFDFWKDPRNQFSLAPDDRAELTDVHMTDEGVGTRYGISARLAGLTVAASVVYTEFVPDERIVDRSSMAMHGSWTYTFEPEGSGTRMTMEGQARSWWRLWPFAKLLDRVMAPRHDAVLNELKVVMGHRGPRSTSSNGEGATAVRG